MTAQELSQTTTHVSALSALVEISRAIADQGEKAFPHVLDLLKTATGCEQIALEVATVTKGEHPRETRLGSTSLLDSRVDTVEPPGIYTYPLQTRAEQLGRLLLMKPEGLSPEAQNIANHVALQLAFVVQAAQRQVTFEEVLHDLAHDLRTPLASALGFAQLLPDTMQLPPKQAVWLRRMVAAMFRMRDMIEQILTAGRLDPETGNYEPGREVFDLAALTQELVDANLANAQEKQITLRAALDPEVPPVYLDKTMIGRALNNLIDNAIKYGRAGDTVQVSLDSTDAQIELRVADHGYGIPAESQATLFGKYVRVERNDLAPVAGTGLGLFIVRNIARLHAGDVTLQSVEGEGSTFIMTIPLVSANLPGAAAE